MLRVKSLLLIALLCYFVAPLEGDVTLTKNSIEHFIPLPLTRQSTDYTCGAAAVLSIHGYFGENPLEVDLVSPLQLTSAFGTDRKSMESYFQSIGYEISVHEPMSLSNLKEYLSEGHPVLCLVQAWDNQKDYTNYWGIGHYIIAIGYDQERIYFMDPWILGNYGYISIGEFMNRWHQQAADGTQVIQWGLAILKEKSIYNTDELKYIP